MAQTTLDTTITPRGTTGGSSDPFEDRRVIVVEKTKPSYAITELWQDVYVVGPEKRQLYPLLARAKCRLAPTPDKADIVFFSGSASDVCPALYGEKPHSTVHWDPRVDTENIMTFLECAYLGIPMVGICGGAQFLHVANHGKLYQHVDRHQGPHDLYINKDGYYIDKVSSVHHQMCMDNPENGMVVLAEASESTLKWTNNNTCRTGLFSDDTDIEAFWYPETACLGFQGHPEYTGFDEYTAWFTKCIEDYILHNPDIHLVGGGETKFQRLKDDVRDNRKYSIPKVFYEYLSKNTETD